MNSNKIFSILMMSLMISSIFMPFAMAADTNNSTSYKAPGQLKKSELNGQVLVEDDIDTMIVDIIEASNGKKKIYLQNDKHSIQSVKIKKKLLEDTLSDFDGQTIGVTHIGDDGRIFNYVVNVANTDNQGFVTINMMFSENIIDGATGQSEFTPGSPVSGNLLLQLGQLTNASAVDVEVTHLASGGSGGLGIGVGNSHKQELTISSNETKTGMQVKIEVPYQPEMKPDFADIRFQLSDGTNLNQWRESYTECQESVWWINPDLTSGDNTVIMTYGGDLELKSIPEMVFDLYLDGNNDIDSSKWTTTSVASGDKVDIIDESGNNVIRTYCDQTTTSSDVYLKSIYTFNTDMIYEWKHKFVSNGHDSNSRSKFYFEKTDVIGIGYGYDYLTNYKLYGNGLDLSTDNANGADTSWTNYKVIHTSSDIKTYKNEILQFDTLHTQEIGGIAFRGWAKNIDYYDDIIVRKYMATEPTVAIGSSEQIDYTFTKKNTLTIDNTGGSALTGYQHLETITFDSDMQPDMDDIVFTETDGTIIPHYTELVTASTSADVWIKYDVGADTTKDIYMYYGNSEVSDSSITPDEMFDFYDGFDGNNLDESIWTNDGIEVTITDGIARFYETDANNINCYSKSTFSTNHIVEYNSKQWVTSHGITAIGFGEYGTNDNVNWISRDDAGEWRSYTKATSYSQYNEGTSGTGTFQDWKIEYTDANVKFYLSDTLKRTYTSNVPSIALRLNILQASQSASSGGHAEIYLDWIRVRQYTASEPTISFGSEAATTDLISTEFDDSKTIWIKPTGTDLENYQIEFDITYKSEMQVDFDDIRFVQGNRELSYWLQEKTDSTSAKFWVKVPYIDDEYGSAVTMMYGNADLVSESDGDSTFEFYFGADSTDELNEKFTTSGVTPTISNGELVLDSSSTTESTVKSKQTFGENLIHEYRVNPSVVGSTSQSIFIFPVSDATETNYILCDISDAAGASYSQKYIHKLSGTIYVEGSIGGLTANQYNTVKYVRHGQSDWYINGVADGSFTDHYYSSDACIKLFTKYDAIAKYDWLFLRQYTDTEPEYFIMDSVADSTKYKEITISPSTDGTLCQYQLFMDDIAYDSDMQIDFDDLRFTDVGNNPIPMFLDSKVDSTSADVYVKVPVIHDTEDTIIRMYYGDATVTSVSDIETTFIFGDHFDGTSLDSRWSIVGTAGTNSVSNSELTVDPSGSQSNIYGAYTNNLYMEEGYSLESYAKVTGGKHATAIACGLSGYSYAPHNEANKGLTWYLRTGTTSIISFYDTSGTYSEESNMGTAYNKYRIDWISPTSVNFYANDNPTPSYALTNAAYIPDEDLSVHFTGDQFIADSKVIVDWVRIMKYASDVPTYSTGSEQTPIVEGSSTADITVSVTGDSDTRTYNTSEPQLFTLIPTAEISSINFTTTSTSWTYNVTVYWSQNTTKYTEVVNDGYANMTIHFTPNMTSTGVNLTAPYSLIDMDNHPYIGTPIADMDGSPLSNLTRENSSIFIPVGSVTEDQLYTINVSVPYNPAVTLISPNESAQEYAFPPVAHDIVLDWSDTTGTYKYFVTQDEAGSVVLESQTVNASNATVTLMVGEYYWYVRGYDSVLEEYSDKSEVRFLNITETYPYNNMTGVQGIVYEIVDDIYLPITSAAVNIWTDTWSDSMTTDTQGYYSNTNLNAGTTYYMQVTKSGYQDSTIEIITPTADTMSIKNFNIDSVGTSSTTTQDVTFVVKAWWGTRYPDVTVTAYRGGITVASGETDSSGSIVFALTPVYEYTITAIDTTRGISKTVSLYPADTYYVINVIPTGGTTEEDGESIADNVRYGVYSQQINLSAGYINASVKSIDNEQVDYTIKINNINDTTLYTFTGSTTNQVNISQIVPTNESYYILMDMDHPDLSDTLHIRDYAEWLWGIREGFDFGWEDQWKYQVTGYILMLLVGGLFSRFNAHIGALSVAGVGMFNFWTGWYPYDTAGQIFANVGIMVVLLFLLRKQEGD